MIDAKFEELEQITADLNNTISATVTVQEEMKIEQNATEAAVTEVSVKVEDAIAQASALGDALAGSFQQYAMVTSQIYGLRAETDSKIMDVGHQVDLLNSTLEVRVSWPIFSFSFFFSFFFIFSFFFLSCFSFFSFFFCFCHLK